MSEPDFSLADYEQHDDEASEVLDPNVEIPEHIKKEAAELLPQVKAEFEKLPDNIKNMLNNNQSDEANNHQRFCALHDYTDLSDPMNPDCTCKDEAEELTTDELKQKIKTAKTKLKKAKKENDCGYFTHVLIDEALKELGK